MTDPKPPLTRREFLETAAGVTVAGTLLPRVWAAEVKNGIPYRTLGNTGENVSCIGLGGYHLGSQKDEQESIRIIRTALDEGINFLDNCWDYNDGASEVRMGKALRDGYRKKAFLMTKLDARSSKGAARQIDESLRRLQTDRIDLLQHHEILRLESLQPAGRAEWVGRHHPVPPAHRAAARSGGSGLYLCRCRSF